MLATLMIGTLIAAAAVGLFLYLRHMRKPENRHPMEGERERNIGQVIDETPEERKP